MALSGSRVGATGSSGVIDPDEFTVGSEDVKIDDLEWRSGSVVLMLDDHVSLSGQTLDFIELDGSISTSLNVSDATVNQSAATWTWSVTGAPWEDGDLLMLRIRETGTGPTVVILTPTPAPTKTHHTHADSNSKSHSESRQREPLSRRCDRNRFSAACTSTCPP